MPVANMIVVMVLALAAVVLLAAILRRPRRAHPPVNRVMTYHKDDPRAPEFERMADEYSRRRRE